MGNQRGWKQPGSTKNEEQEETQPQGNRALSTTRRPDSPDFKTTPSAERKGERARDASRQSSPALQRGRAVQGDWGRGCRRRLAEQSAQNQNRREQGSQAAPRACTATRILHIRAPTAETPRKVGSSRSHASGEAKQKEDLLCRSHVAKAERSTTWSFQVPLGRLNQSSEDTPPVPLPPPPEINLLRNPDFALCCTDGRGARTSNPVNSPPPNPQNEQVEITSILT